MANVLLVNMCLSHLILLVCMPDFLAIRLAVVLQSLNVKLRGRVAGLVSVPLIQNEKVKNHITFQKH